MENRNEVLPDNEMLSLYDYLGRAAGGELGQNVFKLASSVGVKIATKTVSNKVYSGIIMMYPKGFLDLYFENNPKYGE